MIASTRSIPIATKPLSIDQISRSLRMRCHNVGPQTGPAFGCFGLENEATARALGDGQARYRLSAKTAQQASDCGNMYMALVQSSVTFSHWLIAVSYMCIMEKRWATCLSAARRHVELVWLMRIAGSIKLARSPASPALFANVMALVQIPGFNTEITRTFVTN